MLFARTVRLGLFTTAFATFLTHSQAQVNAWTNPVSGHWEDPFWSRGVLPGPSQTIAITNTGYKAVGIFPSTRANYPDSLTINDLQLSAPPNAFSTLLLNYAGTSLPLRVLENCTVATNAMLLNLYSGLEVVGLSGGSFQIQGGLVAQEGGALMLTNVTTELWAGALNLTNATAAFQNLYVGFGTLNNAASVIQQGGTVAGSISTLNGGGYTLVDGVLSGTMQIGVNTGGYVIQYGGTNNSVLNLGVNGLFGFYGGTGSYSLYGGSIVNSQIALAPDTASSGGSFNQYGGYINTDGLEVGSLGDSYGSFFLTNGLLVVQSLGVENGWFRQSGGQVQLGTVLYLSGNVDDYDPQFNRFGSYLLSGGVLNTPGISIDFGGDFEQSGGSNTVAGGLYIHRSGYSMSGGFLSAYNTSMAAGELVLSDGTYLLHGTFSQSGGAHYVANTLAIEDEYFLGGGTLSASNINLTGALTISNASPVVLNPGTFSFAGTLNILGATVSLGRLVLSSNAVINFGTGPGSVAFQASSSMPWATGSLLTLTNWAGSAGGGGSSRVFVGSSATGLSAAQLGQIQFVNPTGFPMGRYAARMLSSGELVPTPDTALAFSAVGDRLSLAWPGGLILQRATNVLGPYLDVQSANSPFTTFGTNAPQQFFRLRH